MFKVPGSIDFKLGDTFTYPWDDHRATWKTEVEIPASVAFAWIKALVAEDETEINPSDADYWFSGWLVEMLKGNPHLLKSLQQLDTADNFMQHILNKLAIVIDNSHAIYKHDDKCYLLSRK